ncbi:radical SAM protein [Helicobacter canadensis]|uniref:radical SAM protein n=1 Tax=Helicobacter canadensis TaxID=123841 RepID=UPI000DFB84E3|nr:radical SAM protein [Helicobacter canadensis]STO99383.1 radical SAM domain-containing protein [Helicobacter canadensis]
MKEFVLDSHKLHYHFERVAEFQKNGDCYPIYMEVSPVGLCNHRCIFCAYDYIDYPNRHLDKERFLSFLDEVASLGLKSILYAGEGEPLIHKNIADFVKKTKEVGIDCGMFSNGELLSERLAEQLLPYLTFLRFSFNGGDAQTYAKVHKPSRNVGSNIGSGGGAYQLMSKVLHNIEYAVNFKNKNQLNVDLGSQFVLLPENKDTLLSAISHLKNAGVDFISVKPFVFQNEQQKYSERQGFIFFDEIKDLAKEAKSYEDDNFKVIFRENAFLNKQNGRSYSHCYGCNFITTLNSAGDLATCLPYWNKEEFVYGNIYQNSFYEIWNGEKRKKIKSFLERDLNCQKCPTNCRPNAINEFLNDIFSKEIKHVNFI